LGFDHLILDPYTGRELGRCCTDSNWRVNFLPFVYELHTTVAMGNTGAWILGIVALVWTLYCSCSGGDKKDAVDLPPTECVSRGLCGVFADGSHIAGAGNQKFVGLAILREIHVGTLVSFQTYNSIL
jgi:PepSY-associated TM region